MLNKLRMVYAAGPGNVIDTFKHWQQGQDDPTQLAITFSGQFYDLCQSLSAEAYVIASHAPRQVVQTGDWTLEHRPIPWANQSVAFYFLGQIYHEFSIILTALRFRADVVVGSNTDCFFLLGLLPRLGIPVIPSLHCVLWAKNKPLSKYQRVITFLNRRFLAQDCFAILSTSQDINQQLQVLTQQRSRPIVNFLSTYRRHEFADVTPVNRDRDPFHVLFAGRLEADKGVFDLLAIAQQFQAEGRTNIVFHVCGRGTAAAALQAQVQAAGLQTTFILQGYCHKPKMRELLSLSHVVIVPTRTDFVEGLNQVVIEGVLAQRPVITSAICPALAYVRQAVVEVPPDDVQAYADAILKLQQDLTFYQEKCRNCEAVQEQFYNPDNSWGAAFKRILQQFAQVSPVRETAGKVLAADRSLAASNLQEASDFVELAEDSQDAIAVVEIGRPATSQRLDRAGTPTDD